MTSGSGILVFAESNKKLKMATQDRSPSLFIGQPWMNWAEKMSISDENAEEDEDDKADVKSDDSDSMKLNKKDMDLFGFCPSRDEFMLAQCEMCSLLIKPQALKHHIEVRHGSSLCQDSKEKTTAAALNSELAKTLLSANKPPTKGSLKQVPSSLLGKSVAAGNKANSSSRTFRKANTNPVVKMERIPGEVSAVKKISLPVPSPVGAMLVSAVPLTPPVVTKTDLLAFRASPVGSKFPLTNGALKGAAITCLTTLPSNSTTPVTTLASLSLGLTTTTTTVTATRPTPTPMPTIASAPLSSTFSKVSKPLRLGVFSTAPTPAAANPISSSIITGSTSTSISNSIGGRSILGPSSTALSSNSSGRSNRKSPKERKFLPCKDREFDANKHCGVVTEDSGKPCTRSLTCKTHALGLRRAVPGRKKSFDDLLREHKAAKEALLKAKAEEQALALGGLASKDSLVVVSSSASAVSAPATPMRLGQIDAEMHRDARSAPSVLQPPTVVSQQLGKLVRLPNPVFQKFVPGGVFPPSLTIKEEQSSSLELPSQNSQPIDQVVDYMQEKLDVPYINRHPRPAAMCTFGARMAGGTCALFSRRMDLVRAALLSALERQLNPPPHKKLCVESNLPKEPQMTSNSKDPYEFTMVDNSSGGLHRQNINLTTTVTNIANVPSKQLLKHKGKSPSSLSLGMPTVTIPATTSPIQTSLGITSLAAALLKPTKPRDSLSGIKSPSTSPGTLSLPQSLSGQPVKRKRSGSGQGSISLTHSTIHAKGLTGMGASAAGGIGLTGLEQGRIPHQQQSQTAVLAPVTCINSSAMSTPLTTITIPSLASAASLGINASLPSKQQPVQGQKGIAKDVNFLLTSFDSTLMNGQYVNITGAQLAELAAAQAVNATAEDKNIKRNRLASVKHSGHKLSIETLRTLQSSSVLTAVPPNTVLVDGSLQGILTPVTSLSGSNSSTFVALTTSALNSNQASTAHNFFRAITESGTPHQVKLTTAFANGIIPSSSDKLHTTAVNHQQHQSANSCSSTVRSGPSHSKAISQGHLPTQATSLCANQGLTATQLTHFKPGAFITKGVGRKLTVQSTSMPVNFPLGLGSLTSPQQQSARSQHTLLLTATPEDAVGGGGVVTGGTKTEIHLQQQISSSPSGLMS